MPEISVIIPCFNQEKYIAECLDSVWAQTFTNYEVIIVNDGSTDDSLKIIKQYTNKYKNFRLLDQSNQGVVFARNNAISKAKGKYIYPLDADDKITPECLEKLYNAIINGKGDIITSRVLKFGKETGEMVLHSPTPYHLSVNNCLVNSALFRKTDFIKAGGYDEDFVLGLEDYDLWLNMVLIHKLKVYRVPDILFFYRIKNLFESRNKQQMAQHSLMLRTKLLKKYPKMKFYRLCAKLQKFFYRNNIKNNHRRIKILGITVYRSKELSNKFGNYNNLYVKEEIENAQ